MKDIVRSSNGPQRTHQESFPKPKEVDENQVVMELKEKICRLKYHLFDCQNQNQALRKQLLMANKLIDEELDEKKGIHFQKLLKQGKENEFLGQEEEAIALRKKISELQNSIQQLKDVEGSPEKSKNQKCDQQIRQTSTHKVTFIQQKASKNFDWSTYEICCKIERKIEYWKNRNEDLKSEADRLRLELKRLVEVGRENQKAQDAYMETERDLRECQKENLNLRSKWVVMKTRNQNFVDDVVSLKEDLERIRRKTNDDYLLLDALTTQQGTFQDLIQRHKMVGENNYHRFKEDLKCAQNKYSTAINVLKDAHELVLEGDSLHKTLRNSHPPVKNVLLNRMPVEEKKRSVPNISSNLESTQNSVQSSVTGEDELPRSGEELEEYEKELNKCKFFFQSVQEELERLSEITISNNSRLNDWRSQFLQSKRQQIKKNMEIRKLEQMVIKVEELTSASKKRKGPVALERDIKSTIEELERKEKIFKEENNFLLEVWENIIAITFAPYETYCSDVDCSKNLFVQFLVDMKKSTKDTSTFTNSNQSENSDIQQP